MFSLANKLTSAAASRPQPLNMLMNPFKNSMAIQGKQNLFHLSNLSLFISITGQYPMRFGGHALRPSEPNGRIKVTD